MELYDAIFTRRSVRQFKDELLPDSFINDIYEMIKSVEQISGQNVRLEFVGSDAVHNKQAQHYILAYCEPTTAAYVNVGYVLQHIDLFIQSKGYGSLWLGSSRAIKPSMGEEKYCIMLAFGSTEKPIRKHEDDFNRLPITTISDKDNKISRAARLAPSAINTQPWKLKFTDEKIVVNYFGRGLTKLILRNKLSKIDLGIVTAHIAIALNYEFSNIQVIDKGSTFSVEILYR
jgi:nitroreductase